MIETSPLYTHTHTCTHRRHSSLNMPYWVRSCSVSVATTGVQECVLWTADIRRVLGRDRGIQNERENILEQSLLFMRGALSLWCPSLYCTRRARADRNHNNLLQRPGASFNVPAALKDGLATEVSSGGTDTVRSDEWKLQHLTSKSCSQSFLLAI